MLLTEHHEAVVELLVREMGIFLESHDASVADVSSILKMLSQLTTREGSGAESWYKIGEEETSRQYHDERNVLLPKKSAFFTGLAW